MLFEIEFDVDLNDLLPSSVYDSWEHFSGHKSYPVPSPLPELSARQAFYKLLKWKGTYGSLRRSWCLHVAGYFRNEK